MAVVDRDKLWSDYSKQKTPELREKLIIEYSGLVKIVAGKLSMYFGYNVEYDDMVGYGVFGLIDAIDKFDYGKGIKFETYASLRIRGEILDQIRRMDWIPRTVRQKQKQLDMAYRKIEERTGKLATDEELAEELGISMDDLMDMQNETKVSNIISLDEYMEQGDSKVEPVETETTETHEAEPVPEEEKPKEITFVQVRAAAAQKSKDGYTDAVRNLIQSYGVEKLSQIKKEDYAEFLKEVEMIGYE